MRVLLTGIALACGGRLYPIGAELTEDDVSRAVLQARIDAGTAERLDVEPDADPFEAAIAAWIADVAAAATGLEGVLTLAEMRGEAGAESLVAAINAVNDAHASRSRAAGERIATLLATISPLRRIADDLRSGEFTPFQTASGPAEADLQSDGAGSDQGAEVLVGSPDAAESSGGGASPPAPGGSSPAGGSAEAPGALQPAAADLIGSEGNPSGLVGGKPEPTAEAEPAPVAEPPARTRKPRS